MTVSSARMAPAYSSGAVIDGGGVAGNPATPPRSSAVVMPDVRNVPPAPAPGASTLMACGKCGKPTNPALSFCGHCGTRATTTFGAAECTTCGAAYVEGADLFCARCGTRVGQRVSVEINNAFGSLMRGTQGTDSFPRIALLNEHCDVSTTFSLDRGEAVVGRGDADIRFDDVFLSPLHARIELRDGELWVRDLGSRNGTWTFVDGAARLTDGDVILVGSQLLRFRRLGYPGPHPPEADATRRMGSLVPSADVAVLEQLRADGSVRDTFHLSPARTILIGRESGDWVFPYDQTMSGRHAEIRSQDAEFFVHDAGSRNGVALGVRGERVLKKEQRILVGDQVLRVESTGQ